jgi:hypothetical protein
MDYYVYELVYSESLEELCARLDVNIFLGSLEYNIKVLNDVVLVLYKLKGLLSELCLVFI